MPRVSPSVTGPVNRETADAVLCRQQKHVESQKSREQSLFTPLKPNKKGQIHARRTPTATNTPLFPPRHRKAAAWQPGNTGRGQEVTNRPTASEEKASKEKKVLRWNATSHTICQMHSVADVGIKRHLVCLAASQQCVH